MKRWLLIVLVACVIASTSTGIVTFAEVKFGNWDKWDEELPPADNERWHWAVPGLNEPREFRKGSNEGPNNVAFLFSDVYFYGEKKGKTKVSVIFYSSGDVDKKDWDIPDAKWALAAFPPKKGKMIIRAYKMQDKIFKFFEQWEIPFKNNQIVVLEDTNFREVFREWLKQQMSHIIIKSEAELEFLPKLVIIRKKIFIITVFPEMIINVL